MNTPTPAVATTRRQRRSAHTQERLLDAATAEFLARGYDALTLAEVTERADLGTGTLYLHFRDKRALYEGVVRRALGSVYQRWERSVDAKHSPAQRVLEMVRITIEFLTEHPELARLCLLDGPSVESWLVDDVARGMAAVLDGPRRELRASLTIGVALAAGRHYIRHDRQPGARQLLATTLAYCAGGLAGEVPRAARATGRRARRAT
jgi:AcrR family transcriptional regulator